MLEYKVPCTDHCNVAADCPVKALTKFKTLNPEKEGAVFQMLSTRDRIHQALQSMAGHQVHGAQINELLNAGCDHAGHSHGHGCDMHDMGHHGEVIQVNGQFEHICDPESLEELANKIEQTFSSCGKSNCHEDLKASLANVRSLIAQLRSVSECTKQMCNHVAELQTDKIIAFTPGDF